MNRKTNGMQQEVQRSAPIHLEVLNTIKVYCILKQMVTITGTHTEIKFNLYIILEHQNKSQIYQRFKCNNETTKVLKENMNKFQILGGLSVTQNPDTKKINYLKFKEKSFKLN